MATSSTPRDIADRAVALAGADGTDNGARDELIKLAGDVAPPLEQARQVLVKRIRMRSDDFGATSGLKLLNGALSQVGKVDDVAWTPRHWRLPR